jgi:DNA polymerase I-like protein with 3'-5' exonuclease and polymerase domains
MDIKDYEKTHNPLSEDWEDKEVESSEDTKETAISEKRHRGKTARSNYRYWLAEDFRKIIEIMNFTAEEYCKLPSTERTNYNIYPPSQEVIQALRGCREGKPRHLYLDIETDDNLELTCFAFGYDISEVFVVPFKRYDQDKAYSDWIDILRSLNYALLNSIPVCHNAAFDLFVLSYRYGLHFPSSCYDTMLAHHRLEPEIEKSLGHCISHLTYLENYHKDQGIFDPQNTVQERKLWQYNGKDVSAMMLVKGALDKRAASIPGLQNSIEQANEMIYPFLMMTLQGIHFDAELRQSYIKENDYLMTRYLECMKYLVGRDFIPSNKQCTDYFHLQLGYKTQERTTVSGNASWKESALRKLKLAGYEDNPMIDFCLRYRKVQKETSMLQFLPWKEKITTV